MEEELKEEVLSTLADVFGHDSFKSELQERAALCVLRGTSPFCRVAHAGRPNSCRHLVTGMWIS